MVWVPSTKVHARVVLSKHVRQKFFVMLIKLCKVESVTEIRTNTVHVHRRTRELASGFDVVFRIRDPVPF